MKNIIQQKLFGYTGFFKCMQMEITALPLEQRQRGFKKILLMISIWIGLYALFFSDPAHASTVSHGLLDDMTNQYKDATGGWTNILENHAKNLFFLLATIEVAWSFTVWVLEKDNFTSFMAVLVKKIMWIGFFYALLLNANIWIPAIIDSFSQIGREAAGLSHGLSPSQVVEVGLQCLTYIMNAVQKLGIFDGFFPSFLASFISLFILGCFFVIALQLLVALVESYIVLSAGIIFLGFGGSRFTSDFVQKYISMAISVGIKLFMLYLIIGVGMSLSEDWAMKLQDSGVDFIRNAVVIAAGAFIYAGLAWMIPRFASSLMSGASFMSAGNMIMTAGAAAVGTVAAVATGVGAAAAGARAVGDAGKFMSDAANKIANSFNTTSGGSNLGGSGAGGSSGTAVSNSTSAASSFGSEQTASQHLPTSSAEGNTSSPSNPSSSSAPSPENQVETSGSISGVASENPGIKLSPKNQNSPSLLQKLKQARPPQLPQDEAGSGTIHIKMDHPHD